MEFDPINLIIAAYENQVIQALNSCGGGLQNVTGYFPTWWTDNSSIATANNAKITGVAVGSTTHYAQSRPMYWGFREYASSCPQNQPDSSADACAGKLSFSGTANNFIFVGTDPNILSANTFYLALASGTPTGGTYAGTSSDTKDTITLTWVASLGLEKATVQTSDQSATAGDRKLTFTYTPPSCQAFTLTQAVTARKFAWVTNTSPGNTCNLGHGYLYNYVYTTYTHPDGAAVPPDVGLTNTPVTENFNPTTIACGNQPGNGSLDANSLFSDTIEVCSTSPLPACSSTNTRTISIAGYPVRTNSLTIANTGLTYTSQGPTQ